MRRLEICRIIRVSNWVLFSCQKVEIFDEIGSGVGVLILAWVAIATFYSDFGNLDVVFGEHWDYCYSIYTIVLGQEISILRLKT